MPVVRLLCTVTAGGACLIQFTQTLINQTGFTVALAMCTIKAKMLNSVALSVLMANETDEVCGLTWLLLYV